MSGTINVLFNYKTSTGTARTLENCDSPGIDKQNFKGWTVNRCHRRRSKIGISVIHKSGYGGELCK